MKRWKLTRKPKIYCAEPTHQLTKRDIACAMSLFIFESFANRVTAIPNPLQCMYTYPEIKYTILEDFVERTLVLVKPDGVQRGLIGEVIKRLENRGLRLIAGKFIQVSRELAEEHYGIHKGKPFYESLLVYITAAPVMAMAWDGPNAVAAVRQTMGATRPTEAAPGSIRHDFGLEIGRNLTHASDSPENGIKEVALWFADAELSDWERAIDPWVFE
jgi:nucleoside-diphosphate kinase